MGNILKVNEPIFYYCYEEDRIVVFITTSIFETTTRYNIADNREIPLENAVISDRGNGDELFDNRTVEYWKIVKTKQLTDKYDLLFSSPFTTSVNNISVGVDDATIDMLLCKKCIAEETDSRVIFDDYNKDSKEVIKANIKVIFKEAAVVNMNYHRDYRQIEKLIRQAKTVTDLQAINV